MLRILMSALVLVSGLVWVNAQDRLQVALKNYDYVNAVQIIDSLINVVAPDSVSAAANKVELVELALRKSGCLKRLQRPDAAAEVISSVLEYDMYNVELMAELADCRINMGDLRSAFDLYSILTAIRPDNVYFKLCKARILYKMNAYDDALSECYNILALDTIPDVLYMAANCYGALGQKDSAMAYYDKLLRINPMNPKAISRKADILFPEKKYDDVLAMTDAYLNEFPDDLEILPVRGLALFLKGDYGKSLETFEYQKGLGDDSYPVHYYAGMNNYMLKRWRNAAEEFTKAYQIDSSDVKLVCRLADACSYFPDRDSLSRMYFDKAIEMMRPDSTLMKTIYDRKAQLSFRENDFLQAIEYYKQSYAYGRTNFSALSSIGYCYERLKDYKKARSYYERYLKVGKPGSSGYKFVEESLDYVKQELFMLEGTE